MPGEVSFAPNEVLKQENVENNVERVPLGDGYQMVVPEVNGPNTRIEVLDPDGKSVGFAYTKYYPSESKRSGVTTVHTRVEVDPNEQGRGLGGKLLNRMLERVQEIADYQHAPVRHVTAFTDEGSLKLRPKYGPKGYQEYEGLEDVLYRDYPPHSTTGVEEEHPSRPTRVTTVVPPPIINTPKATPENRAPAATPVETPAQRKQEAPDGLVDKVYDNLKKRHGDKYDLDNLTPSEEAQLRDIIRQKDQEGFDSFLNQRKKQAPIESIAPMAGAPESTAPTEDPSARVSEERRRMREEARERERAYREEQQQRQQEKQQPIENENVEKDSWGLPTYLEGVPGQIRTIIETARETLNEAAEKYRDWKAERRQAVDEGRAFSPTGLIKAMREMESMRLVTTYGENGEVYYNMDPKEYEDVRRWFRETYNATPADVIAIVTALRLAGVAAKTVGKGAVGATVLGVKGAAAAAAAAARGVQKGAETIHEIRNDPARLEAQRQRENAKAAAHRERQNLYKEADRLGINRYGLSDEEVRDKMGAARSANQSYRETFGRDPMGLTYEEMQRDVAYHDRKKTAETQAREYGISTLFKTAGDIEKEVAGARGLQQRYETTTGKKKEKHQSADDMQNELEDMARRQRRAQEAAQREREEQEERAQTEARKKRRQEEQRRKEQEERQHTTPQSRDKQKETDEQHPTYTIRPQEEGETPQPTPKPDRQQEGKRQENTQRPTINYEQPTDMTPGEQAWQEFQERYMQDYEAEYGEKTLPPKKDAVPNLRKDEQAAPIKEQEEPVTEENIPLDDFIRPTQQSDGDKGVTFEGTELTKDQGTPNYDKDWEDRPIEPSMTKEEIEEEKERQRQDPAARELIYGQIAQNMEGYLEHLPEEQQYETFLRISDGLKKITSTGTADDATLDLLSEVMQYQEPLEVHGKGYEPSVDANTGQRRIEVTGVRNS